MKAMLMKSSELNSHSEALYSLLLKPIVNSSVPWKRAGDEIKDLADCLAAYSAYLKAQTKIIASNILQKQLIKMLPLSTEGNVLLVLRMYTEF